MKKNLRYFAYLVFCSVVLMACGGGGGGGDTSASSLPPTEAVTHIEAQPGTPKFAGYDVQFNQGDYWLYDWKDVNTQRSLAPNSFGFYNWNTTTATGTVRVSLGQPRTILGITFFQLITECTGEAKTYVTLPWSHVASFDNKIYGYSDSGVYIIFDAYNGTWKGGSFFWGSSNSSSLGPAGTFSISTTELGAYGVSYPGSGLNIGVNMAETEYYLPGKGLPVKQVVSTRTELFLPSFGEETLTLSGSSKN